MTVKNALKADEGDAIALRINFFTPDVSLNAKLVCLLFVCLFRSLFSGAHSFSLFFPAIPQAKDGKPPQMYIRELVFRSKGKHLDTVFEEIKDLRKVVTTKLKVLSLLLLLLALDLFSYLFVFFLFCATGGGTEGVSRYTTEIEH
jgi:hypothetical protein